MPLKVRSYGIYALYKCLGNFNIINITVRNFYLKLLIPLIVFYLKARHDNILYIQNRHSILDKDYFNAFLSDIDLTIVIKDKSEYLPVLKTFFNLKKKIIMLDSPEIYYEKEFTQLEKIRASKRWEFIYTLWSIRKINWNLKSLSCDNTKLDEIKKQRSIQISLLKILTTAPHPNKTFRLSDFKFLSDPTDTENQSQINQSVCYYSNYLETNNSSSIQLILNAKEFNYFNSLMPGELYDGMDLQLKMFIMSYEILITKTSTRTDEVQLLRNETKMKWITKLENAFSEPE